MLRARRLKLIADSNKPVFSSTDTEWWLAEAPAKQGAAAGSKPENTVKAVELKKELPPAPTASALEARAEEPAAVPASSSHEFLKESAPVSTESSYQTEPSFEYVPEPAPQTATGFAKREELTWNAKMSCFVMAY